MSTETVKNDLSKLSQSIYNNPDARIRFRIISIEAETKTAIIQIALLEEEGVPVPLEHHTIEVSISSYAYEWMTKRRAVYSDGEPTGEYLTGYRKFLKRINESESLPITTLQFECYNASPDYYKNPFRISINEKHNTTVLHLVNMPGLSIASTEDPVSGVVKNTFYYKRHKDSNEILKLKKKNYRRIEIR